MRKIKVLNTDIFLNVREVTQSRFSVNIRGMQTVVRLMLVKINPKKRRVLGTRTLLGIA